MSRLQPGPAYLLRRLSSGHHMRCADLAQLFLDEIGSGQQWAETAFGMAMQKLYSDGLIDREIDEMTELGTWSDVWITKAGREALGAI